MLKKLITQEITGKRPVPFSRNRSPYSPEKKVFFSKDYERRTNLETISESENLSALSSTTQTYISSLSPFVVFELKRALNQSLVSVMDVDTLAEYSAFNYKSYFSAIFQPQDLSLLKLLAAAEKSIIDVCNICHDSDTYRLELMASSSGIEILSNNYLTIEDFCKINIQELTPLISAEGVSILAKKFNTGIELGNIRNDWTLLMSCIDEVNAVKESQNNSIKNYAPFHR